MSGSSPAGGYLREGKKRREKQMKDAGTWLKGKKKGMKPAKGLYRK